MISIISLTDHAFFFHTPRRNRALRLQSATGQSATGGSMTARLDFQATEFQWETHPRWHGIARPYGPEDVLRLRGSIRIEHTLARMGAEKLWNLLHTEPY